MRACKSAIDIAGTTITSLSITTNGQSLNLAEVWLYWRGTQISPSSLFFSLSSQGYYCSSNGIQNRGTQACRASFCNDGNVSTICHGSGGYNSSILTIRTGQPTLVDQFVIINRQDCCQSRINGASVVAFYYGVPVWQFMVPTTSSYVFQFGERLLFDAHSSGLKRCASATDTVFFSQELINFDSAFFS